MQSNRRQRAERKAREAADRIRRRVSGAAERLGSAGRPSPARQRSRRTR